MNEYVQSRVGPPGIVMMILAVLGILGGIGNLLLQGVSAVTSIMALVDSGAGADAWMAWFMNAGLGLVVSFISLFVWAFIGYAGNCMRTARNLGVVYAGSVLACIPCCVSLCCCLGLPVAIWTIVTLQDEQVQAAFAEA